MAVVRVDLLKISIPPSSGRRYLSNLFPFVAPYLLPATNTLMTCSVYATVAVATNRYVEMTPNLDLVRANIL